MIKRWQYMVSLVILLVYSVLVFPRILQIIRPPERSLPPPPAQSQPSWVMALNIVKAQPTTTYTGSPASGPSASGRPYYPGSVAVHPRTPESDPRDPIIPFGTRIHLLNPEYMTIQGQKFRSFEVVDTGDVNWSLHGESPYWIDIYYGPTSGWSYQHAANHGVRTANFYWFHVVGNDGPLTKPRSPSGKKASP